MKNFLTIFGDPLHDDLKSGYSILIFIRIYNIQPKVHTELAKSVFSTYLCRTKRNSRVSENQWK